MLTSLNIWNIMRLRNKLNEKRGEKMAIIYKCIYCTKDIESDCVYEGKMTGFMKFIENKTKELSDKCECQKEIKKESVII